MTQVFPPRDEETGRFTKSQPQENIRKPRKKSSWQLHVEQFRAEHPELGNNLKTILIEAKKTYVKSAVTATA